LDKSVGDDAIGPAGDDANEEAEEGAGEEEGEEGLKLCESKLVSRK
jgi:hypothetical protein